MKTLRAMREEKDVMNMVNGKKDIFAAKGTAWIITFKPNKNNVVWYEDRDKETAQWAIWEAKSEAEALRKWERAMKAKGLMERKSDVISVLNTGKAYNEYFNLW